MKLTSDRGHIAKHTHAREIARNLARPAKINANREARLDETGTRTRGYALVAGYRFNYSRRGRLVLAL